ncbi:hypothetical protein Bhyg_12265, partial [Pseudolycoriella hygida]
YGCVCLISDDFYNLLSLFALVVFQQLQTIDDRGRPDLGLLNTLPVVRSFLTIFAIPFGDGFGRLGKRWRNRSAIFLRLKPSSICIKQIRRRSSLTTEPAASLDQAQDIFSDHVCESLSVKQAHWWL